MIASDRLISIVIPAYNRTGTLFEAIQSCFAQAYRPIEIIVGDDSTTDAVAEMIAAMTPPPGIAIRYERHAVRQGQSGNVNWLFRNARGARLVLLHDDDLLLPGGLDRLEAIWRAQPRPGCVFGKQVVIFETGEVDLHQTLEVNAMYFRAGRSTGVVRPTESVGLLQQVPNNCYLIDAALAARIGYRDEAVVGYAADADFGIRLSLAMEGRDFVYADDYVSAYRITRGSMMRTTHRNQDHHLIFAEVQALALPAEAEPARVLFLDRHGPAAVLDAANAGDVALAKRILVSGHYGRSTAGVHGLIARLSIACPQAGRRARPYLKSVLIAVRRVSDRLRGGDAALPAPAPGHERERAEIEALIPSIGRAAAERRAAFRALGRERAAA